MKVEHELFAHHYILTGDKDKAYAAAYPHATGDGLKIAARRLINHPEVRTYISNRLAEAQDKAVRQYHEEEQQLAEQEYATMLLKRSKLRAIIAGEVKMKKYFRTKDGIEVIEMDLPPMVVIRAIESDTRLANDWYNRRHAKELPADEKMAPAKPTYRDDINNALNELAELTYGPDYLPGLRAEMVRDNPRKIEEYKAQGLRVLDHIPTAQDYQRMKEEQMRKYAEWRELKKFAEEQLDESGYDTGEDAGDSGDTGNEVPATLQQYPRVAAARQKEKENNTPQNDTKRYKNDINDTTAPGSGSGGH